MKIAYSQMAEVDLMDFDFTESEEEKVDRWMRDNCSFEHKDAYEFILHLHLSESDDWFLKNELNVDLPERMAKTIMEARNNGAARICFYS
jgi:ethanolamine ammonia-lyase large subunit